MNTSGALRIEAADYGGDGVAHTAAGAAVLVPFALLGELVLPAAPGSLFPQVLEPSPERVAPLCPHFGVCGGCQYQMATQAEQLRLKRDILAGLLAAERLALPEIAVHAGEPWGYRNRIRLRVTRAGGSLRLGYNVRGSKAVLPIVTCPIAAPPLWPVAEAVMAAAAADPDAAAWLEAAAEVELFCSDDLQRVQMTFLCPNKGPAKQGTFARAIAAARQHLRAGVTLGGAGAVAVEARTGRVLRTLAEEGAPGLAYRVGDEPYWVTRGGFFQVNRFLLPELVRLVCADRAGQLAWDLFAGVGLFSRVLARGFAQVTAVEANSTAAADLRMALAKLGLQHRAVQATTLDFLRAATVQRERPDLLVLDPPRAGADEEACALIVRLAPREVVYVSCDPTTLARDLRVLTADGYVVTALHLVDLFPQTFHLETVVVLRRAAVAH